MLCVLMIEGMSVVVNVMYLECFCFVYEFAFLDCDDNISYFIVQFDLLVD